MKINKKSLNERIEFLNNEVRVTQSDYEMRDILKNSSKPLRVTYVPDIKYYIFNNLDKQSHYNNLIDAWKSGLLSKITNEQDLYKYYTKYTIDFSFQPILEEWKLYPTSYKTKIYMFDKDRYHDSYSIKWVYDFGFIYCNSNALNKIYTFEECPLYSLIGDPLRKIKFSSSDYNSGLSESKNNSDKYIVYHSSKKNFDNFDTSFIGTSTDDGIWGRGFYFSNNVENFVYGNIQYKCEITLKNPFIVNNFKSPEEIGDYLNVWDGNFRLQDGIIHFSQDQLRQITSHIIDRGHDGVIVNLTPQWTEYIVFKPEQIKIIERKVLSESLEVLQDDINMFGEDETVYATKSDYDIINLLKNKSAFYRFIWDSSSGYYIISNGDTCIHADLSLIGYKQGILKSPYIKDGICSLTFWTHDNEDESRISDGCNFKYKYSFGYIYTRFDMSLEETSLYKTLGKPIEKIELFNEIDETLKVINEQKAYHGTRVKFDKFDLNKFQRGDYGYGVYFTHTKSYASNYGDVSQYEIPDDEFLLDWDWNDQSEYVSDILYNIWQEIKDKDVEKAFERAVFGDCCNSGYWIYGTLSEVLQLSSKATSQFLYEHGIKGIYSLEGDCVVIFNPDDIKRLEDVNERLETFDSITSTESVYEISGYLNRSKRILRGVFDPLKTLYAVCDANLMPHGDLFYKLWQQGWYPEIKNADELFDYLAYKVVAFMWTPIKENAKKLIGFDGWHHVINCLNGALIIRTDQDKLKMSTLIDVLEEKEMSLIEELKNLVENDYTEEPDAFETQAELDMNKEFEKEQDRQMKNKEIKLYKLYNYLKNRSWVHDINIVDNELSFIVEGDVVSQFAFRKWEGTSKLLKDFRIRQYNDEETNIKVYIK